jgi:hypothetical protein
MDKKSIILLSVTTSFITSFVVCSLFLRAGAVSVIATGNNPDTTAGPGSGLKLPYIVTVDYSSKVFPGNSSTAATPNPYGFTGSPAASDKNIYGIYTNWGGNGFDCNVFNDVTKGASSWPAGCPYYNNTDTVRGNVHGNTNYVAHDYAGTCPIGYVMTGFRWGQYWGNRYVLQPECAKVQLHHR